MATITYVTHDGEDYPAPVTPGRSLMQIAVDEAIPG
ncbi:2Fe-2S ferredoxin, partial [Mycobacterium kansasii]